jgi:hypothetical protein
MAGEGYIVKQILLTYLPSIVAAVATVISAIAIIATFIGIRDNQRHNERMQRLRFEEDDRIRKRDTLLKTGEELYQLLRKNTRNAPGTWTPPRIPSGAPAELKSAILLAEDKEAAESAAEWERMEAIVRIYHPDLLPIYSELLMGRGGLSQLLLLPPDQASAVTPDEISKLRRRFHEAKEGLLHILEQRLRSL